MFKKEEPKTHTHSWEKIKETYGTEIKKAGWRGVTPVLVLETGKYEHQLHTEETKSDITTLLFLCAGCGEFITKEMKGAAKVD